MNLEYLGGKTDVIEVSEFYSGNEMYKYYTAFRTKKVWLTPSTECVKEQKEIKEQVELLEFRDQVIIYDIEVIFLANYYFWITNNNSSLRRIDLSNCWKPAEDAISEALGVDDKMCTNLSLKKDFWRNDEEEIDFGNHRKVIKYDVCFWGRK